MSQQLAELAEVGLFVGVLLLISPAGVVPARDDVYAAQAITLN